MKKYGKFRDATMENLDEVMFQNINVTGASSIIPGVQKNITFTDIVEDSNESETDEHIAQAEPKKGMRKVCEIDPSYNPKKKGRNLMVKQVG